MNFLHSHLHCYRGCWCRCLLLPYHILNSHWLLFHYDNYRQLSIHVYLSTRSISNLVLLFKIYEYLPFVIAPIHPKFLPLDAYFLPDHMTRHNAKNKQINKMHQLVSGAAVPAMHPETPI